MGISRAILQVLILLSACFFFNPQDFPLWIKLSKRNDNYNYLIIVLSILLPELYVYVDFDQDSVFIITNNPLLIIPVLPVGII